MPILIIIFLIIALYAPQLWARQILNKYNKNQYFSGNGYELARMILDRMNLHHVKVEKTNLGDHYDPEDKAVRLNPNQCGRKSLTAVVVAAHEVGHAVQDFNDFKPLQARTKMIGKAVKLERIGSGIMVAIPLLMVVTRVPAAGVLMFLGGFATLCIPIIIHFLTLPTEFDASFKRALPMLATGDYIPAEDLPAARRILLACSLTYVASALAGLLNVWRWIRVLRR